MRPVATWLFASESRGTRRRLSAPLQRPLWPLGHQPLRGQGTRGRQPRTWLLLQARRAPAFDSATALRLEAASPTAPLHWESLHHQSLSAVCQFNFISFVVRPTTMASSLPARMQENQGNEKHQSHMVDDTLPSEKPATLPTNFQAKGRCVTFPSSFAHEPSELLLGLLPRLHGDHQHLVHVPSDCFGGRPPRNLDPRLHDVARGGRRRGGQRCDRRRRAAPDCGRRCCQLLFCNKAPLHERFDKVQNFAVHQWACTRNGNGIFAF